MNRDKWDEEMKEVIRKKVEGRRKKKEEKTYPRRSRKGTNLTGDTCKNSKCKLNEDEWDGVMIEFY